jgi:alpha-beta hydrolase superfamily lysophospholipase
MNADARAIAVELARVFVLAVGVALPFAVGVLVGDRAPDSPLEPRYAWVIGVACLAALAVAAESAPSRARRVCAVLSIAPVLHLLFAWSAALAALDVAVLLAATSITSARGARRIVRVDASRAARGAALLLLFVLVPGPLFTLGWGLVSTVLAPAATRVFHLSPTRFDDEREVAFTSRDGLTIRGTFAQGRPGAPSILLVHGLADSRRRLVPWARELHAHGATVLRIDLRAHGTSDGVAVTFADREPDDVRAGIDFLASQGVRGPLHLLAVSMGGGAALVAMSRDGLLVESAVLLAPASDFHALVDRHLPPFEPLHSLAVGTVLGVTHGLGHRAPLEIVPADTTDDWEGSPVLVVHSRSDRTVPFALSERLAERAPWVELVPIDGVSHVDTPEHTLETPALRARIESFLGL